MGLTGAEDQHEVRGEGDGDQLPAVPTNTSTGRVGFGMMYSVLGCSFEMSEFWICFQPVLYNV